jgi:Cu/Ag efflux protein CusF
MKNCRRILLAAAAIAFAVAAATFAAPSHAGSPRLLHAIGVVTEVDAEAGQIRIDQEPVAGAPPASEMLFLVDPPSLTWRLKPGDKVEFDMTADTFLIKAIKPLPAKGDALR